MGKREAAAGRSAAAADRSEAATDKSEDDDDEISRNSSCSAQSKRRGRMELDEYQQKLESLSYRRDRYVQRIQELLHKQREPPPAAPTTTNRQTRSQGTISDEEYRRLRNKDAPQTIRRQLANARWGTQHYQKQIDALGEPPDDDEHFYEGERGSAIVQLKCRFVRYRAEDNYAGLSCSLLPELVWVNPESINHVYPSLHPGNLFREDDFVEAALPIPCTLIGMDANRREAVVRAHDEARTRFVVRLDDFTPAAA